MTQFRQRQVAIFGGAGVFGRRLADLLLRDGMQVWIIGRSGKTDDVASELGCHALRMDRSGGLDALWNIQPDIVVDCAGPFHAYGGDLYWVLLNNAKT